MQTTKRTSKVWSVALVLSLLAMLGMVAFVPNALAASPTPLAVYLSGQAASTMSSANQMYTTSGTPSTTYKSSTVGTAKNYGEVTSQGTTAAWPALSSMPAPTGHGWLLDNTSLEGQTIASGNWSGTVALNLTSGNVTANINVRLWKYSGGSYTQIGTMTLTGKTIDGTYRTYSLPSTSLASMDFATGDKLYVDVWLDITANYASSGVGIKINKLSTDTAGQTGDPAASIVTPGYSATGGGGPTPTPTTTPPPSPTVSGFSPTSGPVGTVVDITGTNYSNVQYVVFGNTQQTTFTVVSTTEIQAAVPSGAASGTICVMIYNMDYLEGCSTGIFTVTTTPPPAPVVSSFSPTSGPVGTAVTVSGSGFTGATAVDFNGTAATFTVGSDSSISTSVPSGATTGAIAVTTPNGTGTSSSSFTVTTGGGGNGVPGDTTHLLRSMNISGFTTGDQFMNDTTLQSDIKSHNIPLLRMPFRDGWTDAQYTQMLTAIKNAGAVPLVIVHGNCTNSSSQQSTDDHWLSLVDSVFPSGNYYVEYGNEEDLSCGSSGGISAQQYTAGWNRDIPVLTANHPRAKFIGPVNYQYNGSYLLYFLQNANPRPFAVSWHSYFCNSTQSDQTCLNNINSWGTHVTDANNQMATAGYSVPIWITEWNLDPNDEARYTNQAFIQQWTQDALNELTTVSSQGVQTAFVYTMERGDNTSGFQEYYANDTTTYQGTTLLTGI